MITTVNTANAVKIAYEKTLLENGKMVRVYQQAFDTTSLDGYRNEGSVIQFTRIVADNSGTLAPATALADDGTSGTEDTFTATVINATIEEVGSWLSWTGYFDFTTIDRNLNSTIAQLRSKLDDRLDNWFKAKLVSGTSTSLAIRPNSRANDNAIVAGDIASGLVFRKARTALFNQFATQFFDKTGSFYKGIIPSNVGFDLMGDAEWKNANTYVSVDNILNAELGKLAGIRFIETNNPVVVANSGSVNVYSTFVFGMDLAKASLSKPGLKFSDGAPTAGNEMGRKNYVAASFMGAAAVTNSANCVVVKTASSY